MSSAIDQLVSKEYQYGFSTDIETDTIPPGLNEEIVRAEYEAYTRNALVQLRRVREGTQIEEDHMRNRQMIVRWLMANTKAIDVRQRDGKTYYVMTDATALRSPTEAVASSASRMRSRNVMAPAFSMAPAAKSGMPMMSSFS